MLSRITKNPLRSTALTLAVIAVMAGAVVYTRHRSELNNPIIPSRNPLAVQQKVTTSGASPHQNQPQPSSAASATAGNDVALIKPTGDFVSNHRPGGSAPTTEASTCNTTPGADCYIQFTMGDVVKKLDTRTTDTKGSAIWYWDIKDAGLYAGTWKITAVTTLNSQTKTAEDAMALVVQ